MSARFVYLDGNGVLIDCHDNLVSEDLFAVHRNITKDAKALNPRYHLIDLSDLDSLEISAENLLKLARDDQSRMRANPKLKIAFVSNHAVVNSVVFMWCGYIAMGGDRVRQFASREEAFSWLSETRAQGLIETT